MTSYQKAIKALEECVKDAMENDIDPGLQSEIWRHYQGMKAIDRQLPDAPKFSFKLDALDRAFDTIPDTNAVDGALDYYTYGAAQPVDSISLSTGGDDVITFS